MRRRTITPMFTIRNANSVPMLTSLAISLSGSSAAMIAVRMPNISVVNAGVWRGLRREKIRGSSPSRLMAKKIRVWP